MHPIRKWIRLVFGFSRTETNGFLILIPLLVAILLAEPVYRWLSTGQLPDDTNDKRMLDSLLATWHVEEKIDSNIRHKESTVISSRLFAFDPNTASLKDLEALGFPSKVAGRILKYRSKGGAFKVRSDMLHVYGVDSTLYLRLFNFIQLPKNFSKEVYAKKENTAPVIERLDMNKADSAEFKKIFGIGSKLAKRIVVYRQKLGGFVRTDQLSEIYGLDTAVIGRILKRFYIVESFAPVTLNINESTDRELSAHPYISIVIAKAIVTYRFQHGNFTSVEDIRLLHILKKEEADKIIPYLSVNP